ncbi:MAG: hypothetical protein IKX33_05030 [Prevotella sp.]|nr:hypothetical protein [Prevotella sp.]
MKKKYIIPVTELIELSTTDLMVPNQMSDPSFSFSNQYDVWEEGEEEDEETIWMENNPDKLMNSL